MRNNSRRQAPVIEGDFVVLGAASSVLEPVMAGQISPARGELETPRPARAKRGGTLFWCCGTLAVYGSFLVSGGYALFLPASNEPLLRGTLSLDAATVRVEQNGAVRISAKARNDGSVPLALPPLALAVKSGESSFLYPLPPLAETISAGGQMSFETRLAAPPTGIATATLVLAN